MYRRNIVLRALWKFIHLLRGKAALSKSRSEDMQKNCIACDSNNVKDSEKTRTCLDCGYEGRSDGGGKLSSRQVMSIYTDV